MSTNIVNGIKYQTSSFSSDRFLRCVGVAKFGGQVLVVNTKTNETPLHFTTDEWKAFIDGVKNGEFDCFAKD